MGQHSQLSSQNSLTHSFSIFSTSHHGPQIQTLLAILIVVAGLLACLPLQAGQLPNTSGDNGQVTAPDAMPQFSVMALPPTEGSDQAQLAVKWSGDLPVRVEIGREGDKSNFTPLAPAITLTEAMSVLPHPMPDAGADSSWRVLDVRGRTLAKTRGSSPGFSWQLDFFGPGLDATVNATAIYQGDLVVAGSFLTAGDMVVNRIARWNGNEWAALSGPTGTGVDGGSLPVVNALTVYNGELIVGGRFTNAGGITVNRIARWDGSQWASLDGPSGMGTNSDVWALSVYNDELIVGGSFATAGGVSVSHIARWDGGQWASLDGPSGTGMDGSVQALTVYNDQLIAGGWFATAGGVTVDNIARWDGSEWASLDGPSATGVNDGVQALTVYNNQLIAGGEFITAGGLTVNRIARWDGSVWAALDGSLGTGVSGGVQALTVYNNELIAGGHFISAGGETVNRIARWNGSQWASLDGPSGAGIEIVFRSSVLALVDYNGELIVGGRFSKAGGVAVNHIARWEGSLWESLDGPSGTGMDGSVRALTVYNGQLIAGGNFTTAGGVTVNRIASWNGSEWSALTGPSGDGVDDGVFALTVYNGELIAGGNFNNAGGVIVDHIARWDGSEWSSLEGSPGMGVNGSVAALTVYDDELIAHGEFNSAGGLPVNRIARWDGDQWSALSGPSGNGLEGGVGYPAFALSVYDGELIAAGTFDTAGGLVANNIARWDGGQWAPLSGPLGTGVEGEDGFVVVYALAVYDDELIVGGEFETAGGLTASNIARWNGTDWADIGGSSGIRPSALEVYNGDLIVGGNFINVGGDTVKHIVRWDGSEWTALGGPFDIGVEGGTVGGFVGAFFVYDDDLFAGGNFTTAGGLPSWRIARYVSPENTIAQLTVSSQPALVGQPVTYTVTVTGSASGPADGQVELSSDSDGTICTVISADLTSGNAAIFTCQHTWSEPGSHQLTATFSGSDTHTDSDDQLSQQIVADEFIFKDRYEEDS